MNKKDFSHTTPPPRIDPSLVSPDEGLHEARVRSLALSVERVHFFLQLRLPLHIPGGKRSPSTRPEDMLPRVCRWLERVFFFPGEGKKREGLMTRLRYGSARVEDLKALRARARNIRATAGATRLVARAVWLVVDYPQMMRVK